MVTVCVCVYAFGFVVAYRSIENPFFAVSFFLVVVPVAWLWGWKAALWCALTGVAVNAGLMLLMGQFNFLVSLTLQGAIFYSLIGVAIGYMSDTVQKLRRAQAEIRSLQELLPICAECKKIRDDDGYWHQVESYISANTNTTFSHGLCPDCVNKYFEQDSEERHAKKARENQKT